MITGAWGRCRCSLRFLTLLILAILFFNMGAIRAEIIEETGTLRGFLAGECPDAAYDNWITHTSEGIASPGYNDYGPPGMDPQTDGFGDYRIIPDSPGGDAILDYWRTILQAFLDEQLNPVDMYLSDSLESFRYELVRFHDLEYQKNYLVIREQLDNTYYDDGGTPLFFDDDVQGSFRNGWGIFILNTEAAHSNVMVQVVHPNDDFLGVQAAIQLFFRLDAGVLAINGAGREVRWTESGNYSNSKSLSDVSRTGRAPLQVITQLFAEKYRPEYPDGPLIIQYHSYDRSHTDPNSIVLSAGQNETFIHKPLRDRSDNRHDIIQLTSDPPVEENLLGFHPAVPMEQYYWLNYDEEVPYYYYDTYGDSVLIPRATSLRCDPANKQENWLHGDDYISGAIYENFLHVEIDEYPAALEDAGEDWEDLFGDQRPPTYETFEFLLEYYDAFHQALVDYFEILDSGNDPDPPQTVTNLEAAPGDPDSFLLTWEPIFDGDFVTYEVVADTAPLNTGSPAVWSFADDETLIDPLFGGPTQVRSLPDGPLWNVAIRAVDYYGNRGVLSNVVQIDLTDDEGIVLTPRVFDTFPVLAWPAYVVTEVDDPPDLDSLYLEWTASNDLEGYSLLLQIRGESLWSASIGSPDDLFNAGDTVYWRLHATDHSMTGNPTVSPAEGWYETLLTDDDAYPYSFDFEQDDGGFSGDGDWEWGQPTSGPGSAFSGVNAWGTNLNGVYSNNTLSSLTLEDVDLRGYGPLLLTWTQWYRYEDYGNIPGLAYDGALVRITAAGTTIDAVPLGGYTHRINAQGNALDGSDAFSGESGGWQTRAVSLQPWTGTLLEQVAFLSGSDYSVTYDGWYIDDVAIVPEINLDPPRHFPLCSPVNDADVNPFTASRFNWYSAIDPDPFSVPDYEVFFTLEGDTVSLFTGPETSFTVRLDSLDLTTDHPAYVYWWVVATSQGDQAASFNTWRFAVSPFNEVDDDVSGLPRDYAIEAAYPNPFNSSLSLRVALPVRSETDIRVFNILGREVAVLDKQSREAGRYTIVWNGSRLASGIYFIRLQTHGSAILRKVVLVK